MGRTYMERAFSPGREQAMAATIWKGHLTFGLISVPIRLHAAARGETISFHQIHQVCGSRIKMQVWCPTCQRVVERKELVKGHEFEDGRYVLIDPAEIEKVEPASAKTMEVQEFVDLAEVDPVYYEASYYTVPESAGEKAYYLLCKAMQDTGFAGLAKIVLHQREHIAILRPSQGGIMLHTLYYQDEVRAVEDYGHPEKVALGDKELEMARLFIQTLAAPFDISKYQDQYRENLKKLIAAKAQGQEMVVEAAPPPAPVLDLMAALKASLERQKDKEEKVASLEEARKRKAQ